MVPLITNIKKFVANKTPPAYLPYAVEHVREAVCEITPVDHVTLNEVPIKSNSVIGKFELFERETAPYSGMQLCADIYYAGDLNYCWQRFVITKELCQCVFDDQDARVTTEEQIDQLVDVLRVPITSAGYSAWLPSAASENFALFAALEILCPIEDRLKLAPAYNSTELSAAELAEWFRIPAGYIQAVFEPSFIQVSTRIFQRNE